MAEGCPSTPDTNAKPLPAETKTVWPVFVGKPEYTTDERLAQILREQIAFLNATLQECSQRGIIVTLASYFAQGSATVEVQGLRKVTTL